MNMKKELIIPLTAAIAAAAISGCSSSPSKTTYGEYLKLGDYKGLEVNKIVSEISDEDIDYEIEYMLDEYTEYVDVDRGAEDGDQVNIDFSGTVDGKEFDGGTDTDYDLIIGSEDFDAEFEEQLIGAKAGDTLEVTQTFSDEYEDELVGKTAVYSVTVNAVQEVVVPEFTDEFCKENTDYDTTEEYREYVRKDLESYYQDDNDYTAGTDALNMVIASSEFEGYPQDLYDSCKKEYDESNQAMAEMFGMDVNELMDGEDSEAGILELVNTHMVVTEIAEREKITVSDEECEEYVDSVYEDSGYASPDEYKADYTEESIRYEALYDKVVDFLLDNANVKEVSEEEYYGESEYESESESDWYLDDEYESESEFE